MSVATSLAWKDKNTGERRDETEWHRCVLYGHAADFAQKYLKKGMKTYVEGRLRTRKWTDKNNIDRYVTEVMVNNVQSLERINSDRQPEPPVVDEEYIPF